jgi:hypothetical protein
MNQSKYKIGDILMSSNRLIIGIVSKIVITIFKDSASISYYVKGNEREYTINESSAIQLVEVQGNMVME